MTPDEHSSYWVPARRAVCKNDGGKGSMELAKILGIHYPHPGYYARVELTTDLKNKLVLIVRFKHNWYTILKIWEAQHGQG